MGLGLVAGAAGAGAGLAFGLAAAEGVGSVAGFDGLSATDNLLIFFVASATSSSSPSATNTTTPQDATRNTRTTNDQRTADRHPHHQPIRPHTEHVLFWFDVKLFARHHSRSAEPAHHPESTSLVEKSSNLSFLCSARFWFE